MHRASLTTTLIESKAKINVTGKSKRALLVCLAELNQYCLSYVYHNTLRNNLNYNRLFQLICEVSSFLS